MTSTVGFQPLDAGDESLEALGGRVEDARELGPDGVARPAEVAEGDVPVGVAERQRRLPVAGAVLALDQGVADEHDAVAVAQVQFILGEERLHGGEQGREQPAERSSHGIPQGGGNIRRNEGYCTRRKGKDE